MTEETHPASPATSRRAGRVAAVVLGAVLLLCVGGGVAAYFLVQNAQPVGAHEPTDAVDGFLTAVFSSHSAREAAGFVCADNRNEKQLSELVARVAAFEDEFDSAKTTWDTRPVTVSGRKATATVRLTLTAENQQVAQKQLRLHLVDQRGWWVCDVEPGT